VSAEQTTDGAVDLDAPAFIRGLTSNLWGAVLAHPAQKYREMYARMEDLRAGDLVVEISGICRTPDRDAVGHFVRSARESMDIAEWVEADDGPMPQEMVYYIRTLDGREVRWVNARFIVAVYDPLFGVA